MGGFVLKQIGGTSDFQVRRVADGKVASLQPGVKDWALQICEKKDGQGVWGVFGCLAGVSRSARKPHTHVK